MSARTNDFELRREAEATPLGRLIDGEPGFLIHPMGGYRFQRVQVSGDERYHDKPEKNAYSHPCEARAVPRARHGRGRRWDRAS